MINSLSVFPSILISAIEWWTKFYQYYSIYFYLKQLHKQCKMQRWINKKIGLDGIEKKKSVIQDLRRSFHNNMGCNIAIIITKIAIILGVNYASRLQTIDWLIQWEIKKIEFRQVERKWLIYSISKQYNK